jgi:hypothetical protein
MGGGLDTSTVAAELRSTDPVMRETAWWIVSRHPEWGGALAGVLRDRLATKNLPAAEQEELVRQLARFARTAAIQELLAGCLHDPATAREARQLALRAMAQSGLRQTPAAWLTGLTQVLASGDAASIREAVITARALPMPKQRPEEIVAGLLKLGNDEKASAGVRLNGLAAVPGGIGKVEPALFTFLRAQLDPDQPVVTRALAADILSRARLTSEQLVMLTDSFKTIGPMEVDRVLEAFAQSGDETVGRSLIVALKAAPVRPALRVEMLKPRLAKFGPTVQQLAEEL